MGCDIHAFVEVEHTVGEDKHIHCFAELSLDRDYVLFGILAGVRVPIKPVVEPRGIPDKLSGMALSKYCLFVADDGKECLYENECSRDDAESWVKSGSSKWWNINHTIVTNPDWHTASYLYLEEVQDACFQYSVRENKMLDFEPKQLLLVSSMMTWLSEDGKKPRFTFWFDN